jgi:hypothetical protein
LTDWKPPLPRGSIENRKSLTLPIDAGKLTSQQRGMHGV